MLVLVPEKHHLLRRIHWLFVTIVTCLDFIHTAGIMWFRIIFYSTFLKFKVPLDMLNPIRIFSFIKYF